MTRGQMNQAKRASERELAASVFAMYQPGISRCDVSIQCSKLNITSSRCLFFKLIY